MLSLALDDVYRIPKKKVPKGVRMERDRGGSTGGST